MPTYKITAPDGKVYNVTGDGTAEEALAQFQAQYNVQVAPRQTQPGTPPQNSEPSAVAEPGFVDYAKDIGKGLLYSGQRASAGLTGMLPRSIEQFLVKQGVSPSQEQLDASMAAVTKGSGWADVGQLAGDVAAQFLPSKKIAQATQGLTMARGIAANLAGQGALNAALTPDAENRAVGAGIGAGSAALGGVVGRVLGGPLRTAVSKEGQTLLDAGLTPTPGQVVAGPNATGVGKLITNAEKSLAHFPIVGDVLRARAGRAGRELIEQEVNTALKPLNVTVTGAGKEAIDAARDKISAVYTQMLPEITVPASSLPTLVEDAIAEVSKTNPLFGIAQEKLLRRFDLRRFQELAAKGQDLTGQVAQDIDAEIGQIIRRHTLKANPTQHDTDLAEGFAKVQEKLRDAMIGSSPEVTQQLANARQARAKLQSLIQASDPVSGAITPKTLAEAAAKRGELTDLRRAGAVTLPDLPAGGGTAGSLLWHQLLTPSTLGAGAVGAGATGMSTAFPLLAGATGIASAYTKPGMRYLTEGVHPVIDLLRKKKLNRDETEAVMQFLAGQPLRSIGNLENSNVTQQ